MHSKFLPTISLSELIALQEENQIEAIYEQLVLPLHEELYKQQDFSFIETLSPGQELLIRYDYVRMQVLQGGFIQLIQNGYVNLLLSMPLSCSLEKNKMARELTLIALSLACLMD